MERIVLASHSPRRKELLRAAGIPFEAVSTEVDESFTGQAGEGVILLSARKARAAEALFPKRFILGADTLVTINGEVLGKPADKADAYRMLHLLSGRTHEVFTGVSVISPSGELFSSADRSEVTFCSVPEDEIRAYACSSEPLDKAGAYALQGRASLWITCLEGSWSSVIGLPLHLVRTLLLSAGYRFDYSL